MSNSRLNDYKFDPDYYKKKYIDKLPEFQFQVTDAMKRGLVVDDILTNGGNGHYQQKVSRTCLKRDDADLYEEETALIEAQRSVDPRFIVSEKTWQDAQRIAETVKQQEFWKKGMKNREFQVLLEGEFLGMPFCGLADWVETHGDTVIMCDLKSTNEGDTKSPKRWLYKAQDYGYIRQLALYIIMHAKMTGRNTSQYRPINFCVWMTNKGYVKMEMFEYSHHQLNEAFDEAMHLIDGIKHERFDKRVVSYDDTVRMDVWR